jgi:hypothetical protein
MIPITTMVESNNPRALLGCRFACISSLVAGMVTAKML